MATTNWELLVELRKRNPAIEFCTDTNVTYISINIEPEALILPPSFHYDSKNGVITNYAGYGKALFLPVW